MSETWTERDRMAAGRVMGRAAAEGIEQYDPLIGKTSVGARACLYADVVARLRSEGWSSEQIAREVRATFRRGQA